MSDSKNIYQRLLEVQKELKAPKGQWNSFGKYNYRNAEDILEAVKPLLLKNDLAMIISDEIVHFATNAVDKHKEEKEDIDEQFSSDRFYVKATVSLISTIDDEPVITATGVAREAFSKKGMDEAQVTGAASSYSRKYALNGMFAIDDTKDSDSDEYKNQAYKPVLKAQPSTGNGVSTTRNVSGFNESRIRQLGKNLNYNEMQMNVLDERISHLQTNEEAKQAIKLLEDKLAESEINPEEVPFP